MRRTLGVLPASLLARAELPTLHLTIRLQALFLCSALSSMQALSPIVACAEGAPGAYLKETNATQKASEGLGEGRQGGQPIQVVPSNQGQNYQGQNYQGQNYQGQNYPGQSYPANQAMPANHGQYQQAQSPTYSGMVQQSGYLPPQQNMSVPMGQGPQGSGSWQADYPPMSDMQNSGPQSMGAPSAPMSVASPIGPMGAPMAPMGAPLASMGAPMPPMSAALNNQQLAAQAFQTAPAQNGWNPAYSQPNQTQVPAPNTVKAHVQDNDDGGGNEALNTIARTVLPIATSVVVSGIMNKMMYGSVAPPVYGYPRGYGSSYPGYGQPYGRPMMNPMVNPINPINQMMNPMNPMGASGVVNGVGRLLGGMH